MFTLYPPKCIFCNKVVATGEIHCKACDDAVNYIKDNTKNTKNGIYFKRLVSAVQYDANFRTPIKRLKKKGEKPVVEYMGKMLVELIKREYNDLNFDFVTTIPMSDKKFKVVGFNHSELLSEYVASKLNLPHFPHLLKKLDSGKTQHELNARERKHNADSSYITNSTVESVKDKVILVIDDIATTGSTLEACSKILLDNGAKAVYCSVVAMTIFDKNKN